MKRRSLSLVFLLCLISRSEGQTSSVTALVQDPLGQTFNNGTCLVQFVPTPGISGPFLLNGSTFNKQPSCTFDSSGNLSSIVSRNDMISPSKSQWQFVVCPDADSQCTIISIPITTSSINISSTINNAVSNISVNSGKLARAYSDSEVVLTPNQGGVYFRTTDNVFRIWNGSTWFSLIPVVQTINTPDTNIVTVNANTTSPQVMKSQVVTGSGGLNLLGATFELETFGTWVGVNTTEQVSINVLINTTNIGFQFTPTNAGTGEAWALRVYCTTTATGPTGNLRCAGKGTTTLHAGSTSFSFPINRVDVPINLTGSVSAQYTISFSTASTSNNGEQDYLLPLRLQ